jgi:hypothetical protein
LALSKEKEREKKREKKRKKEGKIKKEEEEGREGRSSKEIIHTSLSKLGNFRFLVAVGKRTHEDSAANHRLKEKCKRKCRGRPLFIS